MSDEQDLERILDEAEARVRTAEHQVLVVLVVFALSTLVRLSVDGHSDPESCPMRPYGCTGCIAATAAQHIESALSAFPPSLDGVH
jgi:hypothetical protein